MSAGEKAPGKNEQLQLEVIPDKTMEEKNYTSNCLVFIIMKHRKHSQHLAFMKSIYPLFLHNHHHLHFHQRMELIMQIFLG